MSTARAPSMVAGGRAEEVAEKGRKCCAAQMAGPGKPRSTHFPDGTTIRTKALAYRMWREAEPLGWDMTLSDLADALGEPVARVRRVAQLSGWLTKFRTTITDPSNYAGLVHGVDEALETMGSR